MKQVFLILLDNALKYSERGGTVELCVKPDGGDAVATIRNRSEHPRSDELPRVFERLVRGRDAEAQGQPGDGLGLTIARWLVEKQGGAIALVRDTDHIEVRVRFPLAIAEQACAPLRHAMAEG